MFDFHFVPKHHHPHPPFAFNFECLVSIKSDATFRYLITSTTFARDDKNPKSEREGEARDTNLFVPDLSFSFSFSFLQPLADKSIYVN